MHLFAVSGAFRFRVLFILISRKSIRAWLSSWKTTLPNNPHTKQPTVPLLCPKLFLPQDTHTRGRWFSSRVAPALFVALFLPHFVFLTNLKTTFPYFPQPQKETTPLLHPRFAKTARMKTGTWSFWCCALGFIFLQSFFNHFRRFGSHLQKTPQK